MFLFDSEKHEYTLDGKTVPSVTQIIKPLSDFSNIPEETLAYASERGTAVHKACEIINLGQEFAGPLDSVIVPYVDAWQLFIKEKRVIITEAEQRLYHPTMKYAGTFDALAMIDDCEWLLDIKCIATLHPRIGVQLAGYEGLINRKVRRGAVQLKSDGSYRFAEYKNKSDWPVFVSLLTIFNFKENNK